MPPYPGPRPVLRTDLYFSPTSLSAVRERNGLFDLEKTKNELLRWIGDDTSGGTAHTLHRTLERATEADVASVRETLVDADPDNRAAYVIGAFKNARAQRLAAREHAGDRSDLLRLAKRCDDTLRQARAQLDDLRTMIAALPLPDRPARHACPLCGLDRKNSIALAEHVELIHEMTLEAAIAAQRAEAA
jgi:hypothetical protein